MRPFYPADHFTYGTLVLAENHAPKVATTPVHQTQVSLSAELSLPSDTLHSRRDHNLAPPHTLTIVSAQAVTLSLIPAIDIVP